MVNSVNSNGELNGECGASLTASEKEVLDMITKDFATPKEITLRRKTKKGVTYKIIRSLRKKGVLTIGKQMVNNLRTAQFTNPIRLHAQEFNIRIIAGSDKYREKIKEWDGKAKIIDGNSVRLFPHAIEVNSGHEYISDDVNKVTADSLLYLKRFLARLENDLSVILIKTRSENITLVNSHYAEVGNELARQANANKEKIRIYANEDGILWATFDDSFKLSEAETLHPKTSQRDMGSVVKPHFNDLRDFLIKTGERPALPSEVIAMQLKTQQQLYEIGTTLNLVLKSQITPMEEKNDPEQKSLQNYFG